MGIEATPLPRATLDRLATQPELEIMTFSLSPVQAEEASGPIQPSQPVIANSNLNSSDPRGCCAPLFTGLLGAAKFCQHLMWCLVRFVVGWGHPG
jgi:hypothetical protein